MHLMFLCKLSSIKSRENPSIYADFDNDLVARSLLKNYIYYALNLVTNEFWENYRADILQWQWAHSEDGEDVDEGGDGE